MWRILVLLSFTASPVAAMEWLDAEELESSCDAFLEGSTDTDAAFCLAYMQGFLAGADAVPGVAWPDPTAGDDETYADRAARTRLGSLRMLQLRANQPAYCLDESLSALQIVETVAGYLESHEETQRLANADAVYEALVNEFPCES